MHWEADGHRTEDFSSIAASQSLHAGVQEQLLTGPIDISSRRIALGQRDGYPSNPLHPV